MDDNHEKLDFPLYYTPLIIPSKGRKRFAQKYISFFRRELSAFWSFFWRWLLLYAPIWALLMLLYLNLTQS